VTRGRKLAFALVATVLAFAVTEGALRAAGVRPAYQADFAGWRMPANLSGHTMTPMREPHRFTVNTNEDGLRTRVSKASKPGGVLRVAVMGDSTVFGWGVGDDQALPPQMERTLRPRSKKRVEMLNAAQPGYTTAQLSFLFHDAIADYRPDVVLFFPPQHDQTPALVSDWEHMNGSRGGRAGFRMMLSSNSRLYALLWMALGGAPGPDQEDGSKPGAPGTVDRVSSIERAEALDGIRDSLAEWDGQLVMGLMPYYPDLHHGPDSPGGDGPAVAGIRDYATERGLGLVDVRHCCGPDADAMVFDFDKWHLNAAGNEAVGGAAGTALADVLFGARNPPGR
jgi:hypothetical protein